MYNNYQNFPGSGYEYQAYDPSYQQTPYPPVTAAVPRQPKLEVWGNEKTMNMENILLMNIQSCPYFKEL